MIEYLFAVLLVPILPELADPRENHAEALAELERRLSNEGAGLAELPRASATTGLAPLNKPELPLITGQLFEWSSGKLEDEKNRLMAIDSSAQALRLTGLIESSGQRVAILNDGEKDHVVGVGSYVLDTYQVVSVSPGRVELVPLNKQAGGKRLQLNLMPGVAPGGL